MLKVRERGGEGMFDMKYLRRVPGESLMDKVRNRDVRPEYSKLVRGRGKDRR